MSEHDNPFGRRAWLVDRRTNADGTLPPDHILKASERRHQLQQRSRITMRPPGPEGTVNWMPIGPAVIRQGQASGNPLVSGRITALAVGPGGTRVYAASANGGVWYSGDAGDSWTALDEFAESPTRTSGAQADALAVGAIAVRFGGTRAQDRLFVGTGEGNISGDAYFGIGIKYSEDGGQTFRLEASKALSSRTVFRIIIDPDDPSIVFAATSAGLFKRSSPYMAGDADWSKVSGLDERSATDVIVVGSTSGAHRPKTYWAAVSRAGLHKSIDGGASWTSAGALTEPRIALAGGENDPSVVYAFCSGSKLYRVDASATLKEVTGLPSELLGSQGTYDIAIAVDPTNADTIYLAGALVTQTYLAAGQKETLGYDLALWRCAVVNSNGTTPSLNASFLGGGLHPDGHCIEFATNSDGTHDPRIVWVGTDGGPFASTSPSGYLSFRSRSAGLSITQLNYIDHRQDTDAVVYAGCQDNGTVRYRGQPTWFQAPQGDGGGIAVDPNNPLNVMRQYTKAGLSRCSDGGLTEDSWLSANFPPESTDEAQSTGFYGPIKAVSDGSKKPAETLVAFGTNRLWVSRKWGARGSWMTLPTNSDPGTDLRQDVLDDTSPIVSISFADAKTILVATNENVWKISTADGQTWTKVNLSGTKAMPVTTPKFTCVAAEDGPTGTFYVGLGGSGVDHIWYFNAQQTWVAAGPLKADMDVTVNAIVLDPADRSIAYVGSDIGVWKLKKTDVGAWTWNIFSSGLPECAINDVAIHAAGRLLRAATHGRGAWEIPLDATSGHQREIYVRLNLVDSGRIGPQGRRMSWVDSGKTPDPASPGDNADQWSSPDIKVNPNSQAQLYYPPFFPDFGSRAPVPFMRPIDHVDFAELTVNSDTVDTTAGRIQIFVQVHNRGPNAPPRPISIVLMLANGENPPPLPQDYASRLASGSRDPWLVGSGWGYADPWAPARIPMAGVSALAPQVVQFQISLNTCGSLTPNGGLNPIALPGPTIVAAAFVVVQDEPILATERNVGELAMKDRHVAVRRLQIEVPTPSVQSTMPFNGSLVDHTATLLKDGRVMVFGGSSISTSYFYTPSTNSWQSGPFSISMFEKHGAVLTTDGKVLMIGSQSPASEQFDPANNNWTMQPMTVVRPAKPAVALLSDGKIFAAGGHASVGTQPCEVFDPVTGRWQTLANCKLDAQNGQAGLLQDGRVFLYFNDGAEQQMFIFSPSAQTLTAVPQPQTQFDLGCAIVVLNIGHVMLIGSGTNEMEPDAQHITQTMTCEIYDPSHGSWRTVRTKFIDHRNFGTATALSDGRILLTGGQKGRAVAQSRPSLSTILYDPTNAVWLQSPALASSRVRHTATLLQNGKVLLVGGNSPQQLQPNVAELLTPPDDNEMLAGSY
jgi:hypothetical protein